jgi:hypothetical protein
MNKNEILARIQEMKGKRFQYRKYDVKMEDVTLRGNILIFLFMHKNGNPLSIEKDMSQAGLFLDGLSPVAVEEEIITDAQEEEPVKPTLPAKTHYEPQILRENKELLISLRDMLVEDMKKIRQDKTYIPQAKQACNTANSIINLAKLEILMLRS